MEERQWKIGELARVTGLTVRALHHYDELGLLEPSERTGAGHRLYRGAEVGRLYRIVALRRLGLGLDEIGSVLGEGPSDLSALVREHVGRLKHEVDQRERLRRRLLRILDALEHSSEPSVDQLIEAMEAMTMIEKHYTPDQLSQLEARRRDLGEEGCRGPSRTGPS